MKNLALNGSMDIDQEGEGKRVTLAPDVKGGLYGCDGWRGLRVSESPSTIDIQRVNDAPPGTGLTHSLKVTVVAAATQNAPGDYLCIHAMIGAEQMQELRFGTPEAKTTSVSFWVKSSIPGTFGINLANENGLRTLVRTFKLPTANLWTYIMIENIAGCKDGFWPDDLWGYMVIFAACGSTYQTSTPDTWHTKDYGTTAEQTNRHLLTAGSSFQVTGINHTIGKTASPYKAAPDELQRCLRRYEKSYADGVVPGAVTKDSHGCSYSNAPSLIEVAHSYAVAKTKPPIVTLYSPATGAADKVYDGCAHADVTPELVLITKNEFTFTATMIAKPANMRWHWVADARPTRISTT